MNTPIADFVRSYDKQNMVRLHMPGHKGKELFGCEAFDITEIKGADALYEADGIIAESEANASYLFGTGKTVYSTEGSSQCIRAMLYLAMKNATQKGRPTVLSTRNVHKSFVQAAALLDLDVEWLFPEEDMHSLCSCEVSAKQLDALLRGMDEKPIAVYVTSPDYLGGELDIRGLAEVCHRYGIILAVDNAHGAYLHFVNPSRHPIDLGADICCDSAHKTLPVLTGGAYLQISEYAPKEIVENAKQAMALFGSTSPSYLTMMSLDLCNQYLENGYRENLAKTIVKLEQVREVLRSAGWKVENTDPLKLTVCAPTGISGVDLAERLRNHNIECEYADPEYVVCMFTPENTDNDFEKVKNAFGTNHVFYISKEQVLSIKCKQAMSIREAMFAKHETISVSCAVGRICGAPTVSCPPAIPIVVSGERITEEAIKIFKYYGIETVDVVKE